MGEDAGEPWPVEVDPSQRLVLGRGLLQKFRALETQERRSAGEVRAARRSNCVVVYGASGSGAQWAFAFGAFPGQCAEAAEALSAEGLGSRVSSTSGVPLMAVSHSLRDIIYLRAGRLQVINCLSTALKYFLRGGKSQLKGYIRNCAHMVGCVTSLLVHITEETPPYTYTCVCVHIYIERERERVRDR